MTKKLKILLFCMIFVTNGAFCQQKTVKPNTVEPFPISIAMQTGTASSVFNKKQVIPQKFYVNSLGFFCIQELKFEAVTGIPIKFRLGSVQYCDKLEGKINTGILPVH